MSDNINDNNNNYLKLKNNNIPFNNNIINYINSNQDIINDFDELTKDFNDIFLDSNNIIKNLLEENNIKTRKNKLTFIDVLCYIFNYSFIDTTKTSVSSNYNFDNDLNIDRTSYYKKELKVPITFYENIFIKIKNVFNKYYNRYNKIDINDKKSKYELVPVDGTYNNTNINNKKGVLETSLNMGFYNVTKSIPIDIDFKGIESKNKEICCFIDTINKNKFDINNVIFVFDRAYFSYDFIKFLNDKKINYVIRMRNNSDLLNKKKKIKIDNKNINKLKDCNIRIVKYNEKYIITKKNKKNEDVKLEITSECNVITNLNCDTFNDEEIKKIYLSRWKVEIFFKLLKSNFKFANLKEHNKNTIIQYKKKYIIILINIYISQITELIYKNSIQKINKKNEQEKNKTNKHQYNIKFNNSLMINGLKKILCPIIKSELKNKDLIKYCINFIKKTNTIIGIINDRISKIPHTKWYVKSYSDFYKYASIIEALENKDLNILNKNLKLLAKQIKIIK